MISKLNSITAAILALTGASVAYAQGAQKPAAGAAPQAVVPQTANPQAVPPPGAAAPQAAAPQVNPAQGAAAAPRAPLAAPGTQAPAAGATLGSENAATAVTQREAPKGRNPVAEAYLPTPQGLTAKEVAKRAVASSHTIEAKNAELRAAAAKVDSAMYQFFPRVGLKASYTRLSRVRISLGSDGYSIGSRNRGPYHIGQNQDPETNGQLPNVLLDSGNMPVMGQEGITFPIIVDNYLLSATLSVPISDYVLRMSDSIEGTKQNRYAAELNIKAERTKIEGDARIAFYNWARSIGQVAVTENSIERVRARQKDVEASFTVGMATKADVLRIQSMVASTEAGLEAAKAFRSMAGQQLSVIMRDSRTEYSLGEDILQRPAERPIEPLEQLVAEAQRQRYELQAAERMTESLRYAEAVVRKGQLPRVDGFADYTYANPNQRYFFQKAWKGTWAVGAQLTWSLNDILTSGASGDEFSAQRDALLANRRAMADGVRLEVTAAYTDGQRAAAELEAAKRANEASQAAYDVAIQLFRVGKATTTELIDAEGELVTSQLRFINAQIDTKVAQTKLVRAVGRDLSKID